MGDALTGVLDANARLAVRKNSGADTGTRRRLNLVEGISTVITLSDSSPNEEVVATINAMRSGTEAARPATGTNTGDLYVTTDTQRLFVWFS